ncbi:hypothetical protein PUNSTDRAFT_50898 [Punctularia strigosozonata HHB-11173 SS5]|uniref:uncharacterized protein n=1 Tax=Punctularia strigosozonata (strain HHB-11173) TaxID=741275 RepID=UPI00044172EC|nr:uncharacterized protein PUNSTDRAFT_50898 [Punctularia strigosozonata HHB-11173 SS5]EIN10212.1 hypothetical protein PUNSTDRAFT_50898 [Punctularia strigosozonata HHB-11173 SS5]
MPRGPRAHRLPQRLDYALIPAPLDLSLPEASEKHPLPAIIVTPSSPTHEHDFGIAFLAPEKQPSLRERVVTFAKTHSPTLENFQLPSPPTSPLTYLSLRPNRPRFALGPSSKTFGLRTLFLPLLTLFVLAAHLLTHRLAARASHPHLDFHATLHLNSGLDKGEKRRLPRLEHLQ